ncbi:MAG: SCO family protein [Actinomycetota bacterium]
MRMSRALIAVVAVIVVVFIAVGVRMVVFDGHNRAQQGGVLPAIGGPFTLAGPDGKTVTDADFAGRYRLMFFGYTFCPDVCPTALSTVAAALDKLSPEQRERLVPIFVTVDPARDTPKVMKDYVAAFHPAIVGLTGTEQQIADVARSFKVYYAKVKGGKEGEYSMDHSAILYLMGPDGKFVAHFPHGTTADDLAAGLKKHIQ